MNITFEILDPDYNILTREAEARRRKVWKVIKEAMSSGHEVTMALTTNAHGAVMEQITIRGEATHG